MRGLNIMISNPKLVAGVCLGLFVSITASAQELIVYPGKGQSSAQQSKDESECFQWAKQTTGFDPLSSAPPPTSGETQVGGAGRGALRGAVGGTVVGAIAGDAGKGAAVGATSGALIGGIRRHDQVQQQQASQQQQQAAYNQRRNDYLRAYAACLEGRGYTVK
jgi:hypothetical protein